VENRLNATEGGLSDVTADYTPWSCVMPDEVQEIRGKMGYEEYFRTHYLCDFIPKKSKECFFQTPPTVGEAGRGERSGDPTRTQPFTSLHNTTFMVDKGTHRFTDFIGRPI
jgi:hypothetical protein